MVFACLELVEQLSAKRKTCPGKAVGANGELKSRLAVNPSTLVFAVVKCRPQSHTTKQQYNIIKNSPT